jgi:hypothetical protein
MSPREAVDRDGRPLAKLLRDSANSIRLRVRQGHDAPIPVWAIPDLVSLLQDAASAVEEKDAGVVATLSKVNDE